MNIASLLENKTALMIILIGAGAAVITISGLVLMQPVPGQVITEPAQALNQLAAQDLILEQPLCIPSWSCSNWSSCDEDLKSLRECVDLNNCAEVTGRPQTIRYCQVIQEVIEETPYLLSTIKLTSGLKYLMSFNDSIFNATFIDYSLIGKAVNDYKLMRELCSKNSSELTYDEQIKKDLLCKNVFGTHDYLNWSGVIIIETNRVNDLLFNDLFNKTLVCSSSANESINSLKKVCEWTADNIKELVMTERGLVEPGVKFFNFDYRGLTFNLTTRNYLSLDGIINEIDFYRYAYENCSLMSNSTDPMVELFCYNYEGSYNHSGWWGIGAVDNSVKATVYFNDDLEKQYTCSSGQLTLNDLKEVCDFIIDNLNDDSYNITYNIIQTNYTMNDLIREYGVNLTTTWIKYNSELDYLYIRLKANFSDIIELRPGELVNIGNLSPANFTIHVLDISNNRLLKPFMTLWQGLSSGNDYQFKYSTSKIPDYFQVIFHYEQDDYRYINANTSQIAFNVYMSNVSPE